MSTINGDARVARRRERRSAANSLSTSRTLASPWRRMKATPGVEATVDRIQHRTRKGYAEVRLQHRRVSVQ